MKKVLFITGSEGKVSEAQAIMGNKFKIIQKHIELEEIQAIEGLSVIKHKTKEAYKLLKQPLIVEDTSLYFDAWNNLPGALIKWFLKSVNVDGICKMLKSEKNRKAWAEVIVCHYDGKTLKTFSGKTEGEIPISPQGSYGFGWDSIFIPKSHSKTFGEMDREEKNKISMRKIAFTKLKKYLLAK